MSYQEWEHSEEDGRLSVPHWDRGSDPPKAQDFVLVGMQWWVVFYVVHPSNRFVCFRDGVRRTFELSEMEARIIADCNKGIR